MRGKGTLCTTHGTAGSEEAEECGVLFPQRAILRRICLCVGLTRSLRHPTFSSHHHPHPSHHPHRAPSSRDHRHNEHSTSHDAGTSAISIGPSSTPHWRSPSGARHIFHPPPNCALSAFIYRIFIFIIAKTFICPCAAPHLRLSFIQLCRQERENQGFHPDGTL